MLKRGVLLLLIAALAVLAAPGLAPPAAANPTRWLVGADSASCAGDVPDFSTIFEAILIASPGDTIHVCPGDYMEPSMTIYDDELTIEGSGASVTHVRWPGDKAAMFFIVADHVVIEGLDLDATPAHPTDASTGISIGGDSATIQNNEIRNATGVAVSSGHVATPSYVQVLNNSIHDSENGVSCRCYDSTFSGNTVNVGGNPALVIAGPRNVITSNVVVSGTVQAWGDDLSISNNEISAPNVGPLLDVLGNRIGVTDNTLSGTTGYGIQAETHAGGISTDVTIARNTFSQVDKPIRLYDDDPSDGFPVTASH